ncbi:MAG TPA: DUF1772 domain-containing protein [Reyranella sp.]
MLGFLALVTAALFTGAAFYVNFAEQPARLALDDPAALVQWQRSYERAALMQASLAMLGFVLGLAAWLWEGRDLIWLVGAFVLLAPWPYTLLIIKPVNDRLKATGAALAGADSRALIKRWGRLHAGRTVLGVLATAIFFCAALPR